MQCIYIYIYINIIYIGLYYFAFIAFKIITSVFFLRSIADLCTLHSRQISGTRILQYNLSRILLSIFHLVCIIQCSQFFILLLYDTLYSQQFIVRYSQTLYYNISSYGERQLIRFLPSIFSLLSCKTIHYTLNYSTTD